MILPEFLDYLCYNNVKMTNEKRVFCKKLLVFGLRIKVIGLLYC